MLDWADVPRPNNVFWVGGEGFLRVVQPQPRREVLLAGETARLWELLDEERHSVAGLVERMAAQGIAESHTLDLLARLQALELITARNHLWKEA